MDVPRSALAFWNGCATPSQMGLELTILLCVAFAGAALFAGWRGARPPDLMKGPRLVPWRPLMALAAVGLMIFLVHLVNLLGFSTGR